MRTFVAGGTEIDWDVTWSAKERASWIRLARRALADLSGFEKRGRRRLSGIQSVCVRSEHQVTAEVQGSEEEPYEVFLVRDEGGLEGSCSCPYSEGELECKHVWAVLTALLEGLGESKQLPPPAPVSPRPAVKRPKVILRVEPSAPRSAPPKVILRVDPRAPRKVAPAPVVAKPLPDADDPFAELARLFEVAASPHEPGPSGPTTRFVWRVDWDREVPAVEPYEQRRNVDGTWTPGRKVPIDQLAFLATSQAAHPSPEVRAVGRLANVQGFSYSRQVSLDGRLALEALEGSPNVAATDDPDRPLSIRRGEVALRLAPQPKGLGVEPVVVCDAAALPLECPIEPTLGVAVARDPSGLVLVARVASRAAALVEHLVARPMRVPWSAGEALLLRMAQVEALLPLHLPEGAAPAVVPADTRLRLVLEPRTPDDTDGRVSGRSGDTDGLRVSLRVRPLDRPPAPGESGRAARRRRQAGVHGPALLPGEGRAELTTVQAKGLCRAQRDLSAERSRATALAADLGLSGQEPSGPWTWSLDLAGSLALLEKLQDAPPADVVVEWPKGQKLKVSNELDDGSFKVVVRDMREWFQLDGELDVDGDRIELALVLAALRDGQRLVPLGQGRFLRLSAALRSRLEALRGAARPHRGKLELDATAAPVVADAIEGLERVDLGAAWRQVLARLGAARRVSVRLPRGLRGTLRDYQRDGWAWLKRLSAFGAGACLADDMGLGKTIQAIALLLDRASLGPTLVVAPTSVVQNWARELERFAPSLRVTLLRETKRDRATLAKLRKGEVLLASYDLARIEADALRSREWGTLVLDEAQRVKNARTRTAEALAGIDARWRLALTGTPLENRLSDLWSLFRIVSPGLLGSWESFRERFALPIERDKDAGQSEALARLIRPYVLRRTKEQVLTELPPRSEARVDVKLSKGERTLYDDARIEALASLEALVAEKGGPDARFHALAALTRLRQLACHPALVESSWRGPSAKLSALLELVHELVEGGHRALVFSQFTSHLALVRAALEEQEIAYCYLDGSTPARARQVAIDAFQGGTDPLFLISLKAGGVGLNLTGADYVIHLDPWWNPAVEDQATGRAHRIGQTRPVTVYRLVAKDTIEERILALHEEKRGLVSAVLEGTDRASALSTEELVALIRGE